MDIQWASQIVKALPSTTAVTHLGAVTVALGVWVQAWEVSTETAADTEASMLVSISEAVDCLTAMAATARAELLEPLAPAKNTATQTSHARAACNGLVAMVAGAWVWVGGVGAVAVTEAVVALAETLALDFNFAELRVAAHATMLYHPSWRATLNRWSQENVQ
mmetsp:Transcript_31485/g.65940  ORF Transcript_31485/g.65940 Transcript_31485/m.65940 type:complete len:163 (+) Transcript_31485:1158-1646(+)